MIPKTEQAVYVVLRLSSLFFGGWCFYFVVQSLNTTGPTHERAVAWAVAMLFITTTYELIRFVALVLNGRLR